MRFCTSCHRFTAGQPLFCANCGRTYNVRLCPRQHVNPRHATVCSACGSRELSDPQPRPSAVGTLSAWVLRALPGTLLLVVSILVLFAFAQALLTNQEVQGRLMVLLLIVAMGWWLITMLPPGMRGAARWGWKAVKRRRK